MSNDKHLEISQIQSLFDKYDIFASPFEVHGIITGLVAGDVDQTERDDVLMLLADLINDGQGFPKELKQMLLEWYQATESDLDDGDLSFSPLLLDDDDALADRVEAMLGWIQGFLVGFGVRKTDFKNASKDVQEALNDFAEITKMDSDMSEDEEAEEAYFEIVEYIRISTLLCFTEFNQRMRNIKPQKPTLH